MNFKNDSRQIFQKLAKASSESIAVFDIDSTLLNVTQRTQAIVEAFSNEPSFIKKYQIETEQLKSVKILDQDWGLRSALKRHGLISSLDFFEDLHKYWRTHFFSNTYLPQDQPYPGAKKYLQELDKLGVQILYLTARDQPNMREGTLLTLDRFCFPLKNPDSQLIMKPEKGSSSDENFKAEELTNLFNSDSKFWFFENEPVILDTIEKKLPEINLVFISTVHSGRAPDPDHLPTIPGEYHI